MKNSYSVSLSQDGPAIFPNGPYYSEKTGQGQLFLPALFSLAGLLETNRAKAKNSFKILFCNVLFAGEAAVRGMMKSLFLIGFKCPFLKFSLFKVGMSGFRQHRPAPFIFQRILPLTKTKD
jgi:hypothetical protein